MIHAANQKYKFAAARRATRIPSGDYFGHRPSSDEVEELRLAAVAILDLYEPVMLARARARYSRGDLQGAQSDAQWILNHRKSQNRLVHSEAAVITAACLSSKSVQDAAPVLSELITKWSERKRVNPSYFAQAPLQADLKQAVIEFVQSNQLTELIPQVKSL